MLTDNYEDLAKTIVDARFAYCGLEHPLLSMLHEKALSDLLLQGSMQDSEINSDTSIHQQLIPLPILPDPSSLKDIKQVDMMELITRDALIPPLPSVLYELQRIMQEDLSSAETVANVVRSDAGLSTFLLRLVNSAFYSFPARIDTISRAVSMIGIRPLHVLSMGMVFQDMINATPEGTLNIPNFWRHSIAVGITAQELWTEMGNEESEQIFTAGLLHDIGKLAFACLLPKNSDFYEHLLIKSRTKPSCEIEHELLGFEHSRFGGMLLRKWNMPTSLTMPVIWHHQPQIAVHYKETAVIHLADILVNAMGINVVPGAVMSKLDIGAWEATGVKIERINAIMSIMFSRLHDACKAFDIQPKK